MTGMAAPRYDQQLQEWRVLRRRIEEAGGIGSRTPDGARLRHTLKEIATHPDTPEPIVAEIAETVAEWTDNTATWNEAVHTLYEIAKETHSPKVCSALARSRHSEIVTAAAQNPHLPEEDQLRIVKEHLHGRGWLTTNPGSTEKTLRALHTLGAQGDTLHAHRIVAHPNCPLDLATRIWDRQLRRNPAPNMLEAIRQTLQRHPQAWELAISYHLARQPQPTLIPTTRIAEWGLSAEELRTMAHLLEDGWTGSLEELRLVAGA